MLLPCITWVIPLIPCDTINKVTHRTSRVLFSYKKANQSLLWAISYTTDVTMKRYTNHSLPMCQQHMWRAHPLLPPGYAGVRLRIHKANMIWFHKQKTTELTLGATLNFAAWTNTTLSNDPHLTVTPPMMWEVRSPRGLLRQLVSFPQLQRGGILLCTRLWGVQKPKSF